MRRLLPDPSPDALREAELAAAYAVPAGRHVRVNFVLGVDGAADVGGVSAPLSSPADRRVFRLLRALADVVLVGAGTVRAEGYRQVRLPEPVQDRRRAAGRLAVPPVAVVSTSACLDPDAELFRVGPALVLTGTAASPSQVAALRRVTEVIVAGDEEVDPVAAVDVLAERGLTRVLCEGGPALLARFLAAGCVDELCLTLAPLLGGPDGRRLLAGPALPDFPVPLRLLSLLEEDGVLLARYAVARDSADADGRGDRS